MSIKAYGKFMVSVVLPMSLGFLNISSLINGKKKKIHKLTSKNCSFFFFLIFYTIFVCRLTLHGNHRSSSFLHHSTGELCISYNTFVLFPYSLATCMCPYLHWKQGNAQHCLAVRLFLEFSWWFSQFSSSEQRHCPQHLKVFLFSCHIFPPHIRDLDSLSLNSQRLFCLREGTHSHSSCWSSVL